MNWANAVGVPHLRRISIDSRQVFPQNDALFVALQTASGDGHKHLAQAFAHGCPVALVAYVPDDAPEGMQLIRVEDPLATLHRWAQEERALWQHPVVALVGSNGKTIVKEWAAELLRPTHRVERSPRSYNSQVGVPLSVLSMASDADVALVELGISLPGEMEPLVHITRPTGAVFTHFGSAHEAGFASEEQKLHEKMRALEGTDFAVWCADQARVHAALASYPGERCDWSTEPGKASFLVQWTPSADGERSLPSGLQIELTGKGHRVVARLPFNDPALAEDAVHAAVLALRLGAPDASVAAGLAQLAPLAMRLEVLPAWGGGVVINDSYAADEESLRLAWDVLNRQPRTWARRAILGPMEQSRLAPEAFRADVVRQCTAAHLDSLWAIGEWVEPQHPVWRASGWKGTLHAFATADEAVAHMAQLSSPVWTASATLIKGPRSFRLERLVPYLQAQQHSTLLEVDLQALADNAKGYRERLDPRTKIMAMVKASAYGLGAVEVARTLCDQGVDLLGVAFVDEGLALRQAGITAPIMVMNPGETAYAPAVAYGLEPEIYDLPSLHDFGKAVRQAGVQGARIHIKVDTGMHRLGFSPGDVPRLLGALSDWPELHVASAMTHLASADKPEFDAFTTQQLHVFVRAADALQSGLGYPLWKHALNSAGAARFPQFSLDLVRLGLGLYGYSSVAEERTWLRPVARLTSVVSQVRTVPAGDSVSYGCTWVAPEPREIATVPMGYADGFSRSLSNGQGSVWIRGKQVPVVGVVCMDMFMVDVTGLSVQKGDAVEWFGAHQSLYDVAAQAQTIPYEILTGLSPRIKRMYVRADH